ncbi:MAG: Ig-like domain-containing protein, partial [Verrucomicrobiaceae bacterium]
MKDSLSFTHCQSRRASHRIAWRVKALSGMVALITLTLGDIAQAVETVFVSPNVLTVGGAEGFSNADDAVSAPVPIGFTFCYGGVDYTQAVMSTNGVLYFSGADTSYTNGALSGRTSQLGVYALWDDLFVGPSGNPSLSTAIYYTSGSPGNRVFIMQWTTWYSYNEPYEVGTFNVVLYEGTNKIDIYYRNMLGTSVQRGYGASATIGLAVTSTYSTQYSIDSAVATEGKLLTYTPSAGGATPYSLTEQTVTPATTAAIPTYYLLASTNPKQPTNLSAAPGTPAATSATLSWDLSTSGVDPTTYTIRYATNEQMADLNETSSFSPPEQTYILTGLTQGQTYYWQVVSRVGTLYTSSITSTFRQTANQAPVASAGSFSTQVNTPYSGQLVATDADNNPTSSGLIYSITSPPGSGSAVITNSATGAFTYTPANGFAGNTSFGFKAFDGTAYSAEAITSVAVISTGPSVASNNAIVIINEGNSASNTGTFSDPEGNATVAVTASIGSISKDSAAGTWSWSYTPADGPDNSQTVTITANDSVNTPVTTTFALTVNNIAPTALAQSVATNEDTTKLITLGATDPGADTQTFSIGNGPTPAQGTLSAITGNQVTFTPALNFNGSASFTFKATDSDGADSAPATVTLTVDAVNDAPSFTLSMAGGDASINGLTVGGTTYYPAGGATVAVAPDLTYTNSGSPTTTGAQVSIDNGQNGDVLDWNTTLATSYGVSGSYNTTSKVLSFTGTATTAQYQDILRSVTYKNAAGTPTADRTISFNVGLNTLYNPGNGHYYEYISSTLNWTNAKAAAAARTFQGMNGYLATVTTQSENDFIKTKLLADAWIGASDDFGQINSAVGSTLYANQSASEGKWYWVTGPEAGIQFSQNNSPLMSSVSGRYQRWNGGEPNNAGSEHYAEFYTTSFWNDLPNGSVLPYVVEYGGLPGDPVLTLSLTGSRTITYAPMVLEDSGPFSGGTNFVTSISPGPNESGQTVSFTVTNSDHSLFSVQPVISPSGTLTFTPALNAYGWCTVSVTAVDSGGIDNGGENTSAARTFTLSIGPVNDAPTDIAMSATTIAENNAANASVGTLSTTDVDAGGTFTYTLVSGTGDTDNASFSISGDALQLTRGADYETQNSYAVRVRTTDAGGLFYEEAFTISIS